MRIKKVNSKILIGTLAVAIVTVAIAVPIAIVFGNKKDKYDREEITTELKVGYGMTYADLPSLVPVKPGLKAEVDKTETTYKEEEMKNGKVTTEFSKLGTTNLVIAFNYELDGTNLDIKAQHVVYKLATVIKGNIVKNDVKDSDRTSAITIGYGQLPTDVTSEKVTNGVTENVYKFKPTPLAKYMPWTLVSYTTAPTTQNPATTALTEAEVKALAIGQKYVAIFTTQPDSNHEVRDNDPTLTTVTNNVVYTVAKAEAKTPIASSTKDFNFGPTWTTGTAWPLTADLPSLFGYNAWGNPTVKRNQATLTDLTTLVLNDTFTATFTATLMSDFYTGDATVTHTITYTAKKGTASTFTNTAEAKDFKFTTSVLPIDGAPAQVLGYNAWSAPVYKSKDGATTYTSGNELKVLPLNAEFTATYNATLDTTKFDSTVAAITKVVTFKVIKADAATYTDPNTTANFAFGTATLPVDGKPTATDLVVGYDAWSNSAKYTSLDGLTTYADGAALAAINAGSKFIATYEANLNANYTSPNATIKKVVTFTVQPVAAGTFTETTKAVDYVFDSPLPAPAKPAAVMGYNAWSNIVFSPATFALINALNVGTTFTGTFEATLDSNHTGAAKITQVITYTVRTALVGAYTDKPENLDYAYGSAALPTPATPANVVGYTWGTVNMPALATVQALGAGATFTATFTATAKTNYTGNPITHTITYTIQKSAAPTYTDVVQNLDYLYRSNTLPTPTAPAVAPGYLAWGNAVVPALTTIQALNAGQTFQVTFAASVDANHTGPDITHTIIYTIQPAAAGVFAGPTTGLSLLSRTTTSLPTITISQYPTRPIGYDAWTGPVYSANGDTLAEVQALNINDTFTATYTSQRNANYTGQTATITYIITYRMVA